jgi:hypothetical protein
MSEIVSTQVRLSVLLQRQRLNVQLADGADPASSPELMLRARQLVQRSSRQRVARALRRVVHEGQQPRGNRGSSIVPVSRSAVSQWGEGLLGLADAIELSDHVNACGIARALYLITDGAGPLYRATAQYRLSDAIWSISDGLHA